MILNTKKMIPMKLHSSRLIGIMGAASLGSLLAPPNNAPILTRANAQANAQTNAATKAPQRADFGALKVIGRPNGVRLEGNAYINRPELNVNADVIALDYNDRQITQVRARGKVNFKLDLPARTGGAPAHVEATCNEATLDPATRTLVLTGDVDGFYQVRGSGRNTLRGEKATLHYPLDAKMQAEIEGGTGGVRLIVPGSAVGGDTASIGTVVLTASRAVINEADGTARLIGSARAVSSDGPNKFDMSAPEFILSRDEAGAFNMLKTTGRTKLQFDLPPETPNANTPAAKTTNTPKNNTPGTAAGADATPAAAANNDMQSSYVFAFEGKVEGSYRLQAAGAAAEDYRFNGDRADIRINYVPEQESTRAPKANASGASASGPAAPAARTPSATAPNNPTPGRAANGTVIPLPSSFDRPTQVQVAADGVTMRRVLTARVAGSLGASGRLRPELQAEIYGEPSTIGLPVFNLGL
jgi:lipopolysaccharide export system protein LptA